MRTLKALTQKAQNWIDDNVVYEEWQLVEGGIAGDWRMIEQIAEAMIEEGFRSGKKWWQPWLKVDFQVAC